MSLFKKKQMVPVESSPRSIIDQIAKIVQVQHQRGLSKFVIAMSNAKYFELGRELQSRGQYVNPESLSNGIVLPSVLGIPILPCPTSVQIPADISIIAYTDEIMTVKEAMDFAHLKRDEIGKIKEI